MLLCLSAAGPQASSAPTREYDANVFMPLGCSEDWVVVLIFSPRKSKSLVECGLEE